MLKHQQGWKDQQKSKFKICHSQEVQKKIIKDNGDVMFEMFSYVGGEINDELFNK